ncbi:FAD/NAD(P)-binding oxidoreductase, partial [Cutibacterium acnes]
MMQRRQFVSTVAAGSALGSLGLISGCATTMAGGSGGATAAKYTRLFSEGKVRVTLIEPNAQFVSCPISNLVIGGIKQMADITIPYENLEKRHGVKIVRDRATAIDADKRLVKLAGGGEI